MYHARKADITCRGLAVQLIAGAAALKLAGHLH